MELNEPLNTLQRLCEELEYSELLDKAARMPSALERMVRPPPLRCASEPFGAQRLKAQSPIRLLLRDGHFSEESQSPASWLCAVTSSESAVGKEGLLQLVPAWGRVVLLVLCFLFLWKLPSDGSHRLGWKTCSRLAVCVYFYYPGWTEFNFLSSFSHPE